MEHLGQHLTQQFQDCQLGVGCQVGRRGCPSDLGIRVQMEPTYQQHSLSTLLPPHFLVGVDDHFDLVEDTMGQQVEG